MQIDLKRLLETETKFFEKIPPIASSGRSVNKNIGVIVVAHILPDAVPYLRILNTIFSVDVVFVKQKSINQDIFDTLKGEYKLVLADREKINDITYLREFLNEQRDGYIFIDIGGYFSNVVNELRNVLKEKFLGCIEDTENGLQRYSVNGQITFPFYQVARSPLKQNEDFLVGQAITFSAEALFRENGIILNGQKVGVFGYGKVGRGVASALRARQANVTVCDIDPVKVTHAYSHGFTPQNKDTLLKNSDIICLATGTKSLLNEDFYKIKNDAILFSITSSDDSIDTDWLAENFSCKEVSPLVTQYRLGDSQFYLLNNGNAINFIHGTTVGHFILLVQAEIVACAIKLSLEGNSNNSHSVPNEICQEIAQYWLDLFTIK